MMNLWLGMALLIVVAIVLLAIPFFVKLRRGDLVRESANIEIYKSQLQDLENEKANGAISEDEYQELSAEIKRNLLLDTERSGNDTNHEGGKWIIGVSAVFVLVFSVVLYQHLGAENELAISELLEKTAKPDYKQEDAAALLERLYVQTEKTPEDVELWYMVGRIHFDMGQYDKAVNGFSQVIQKLPEDAKQDQAVAMAQLAQAQFFADDRKLNKATESMLQDVIAISPKNDTALGLLGVAAYDSGRFLDAVRYWYRLLRLLPPGSPNAQAIMGGLERARTQLTPEQAAAFKAELEAAIKARISITIDLDDSIKSQVPLDSDLFVLAKAEQGPPMPLAVQRLSVNNWPVTVVLDDSMAMMEDLRLSAFDNVVITARISKNGTGNAQPGDLQGQTGVVKSSITNANIVISEELK